MIKFSSEMLKAFECLGVSPDADRKTVRSAWKAKVRAYHPDQYKENKAEGNRRLAELNAAFDLLSEWSLEDVQKADREARKRRAARRAAEMQKAAAHRKAEAKAKRETQAKLREQALKRQRLAEAAAREKAAKLDREDALKRAAKTSGHQNTLHNRARRNFLNALGQMTSRPKASFSFSF